MDKLVKNKIAELRTARGWTQQDLAERVCDDDGNHPKVSTISKLELGKRRLTVPWLNEFSRALRVNPGELVKLFSQEQSFRGFEDNVGSWIPPENSSLERMTTETRAFYRTTDNCLDDLNIFEGTLILMDIGSEAIQNVTSQDVVIAQVYDEHDLTKATTIVRQFIHPAMLITNSATNNQAPINMRTKDVHIKGVMIHSVGLPPRS